MFGPVFQDLFLVTANKYFHLAIPMGTLHKSVAAVVMYQGEAVKSLPAVGVWDAEEPVDRFQLRAVICLEVTDSP